MLRLLSLAICVFALSVAAAALAAGVGEAAQYPEVRVFHSGHKNPEMQKTLPVVKRAGQGRRVLIPLSVGRLEPGDRLQAGGDFEITICLKAHRRYQGFPCIGKVYGYNPKIIARIVVAPGPTVRDPARTLQIGAAGRIQCSQKQPNRNRHCLLSMPMQELTLPDELPCSDSCYVNLIAEAVNRKARPGEKVVVGSHSRSGRIHQSRSDLVVVRSRPGNVALPAPARTNKPRIKKIPVGNEAAGTKDRVIYSIPVHAPQAGESIVAEAAIRLAIGHLRHNVAVRSGVVLATKPGETEPGKAARRIAYDKQAKVSLRNGWSCTRGRSAHKSPCLVFKPGAITFEDSSPRTFYVNVVVGAEALLLEGQRYRKGSKVRVAGGRLRVWRHGP